jgi:hyaluronan synthase
MLYQRTKSFPRPKTSPKPPPSSWDFTISLTAIVGLVFLIYLAATGILYRPFLWAHPHLKNFIIRPSIMWATMGYLLLIFRTLLWMRYKPHPPCGFDEAPALTVVIPAYNEGSMVEQTIYSVAAAHYPGDRLEIIAVDDGSRDDTWHYMNKAAQKYPELVRTIRFPENRGKRAALAEAFRIAKGEIVVTIDSDSVIERDALLELAGPFRDPLVGAVAGKVVAYNRKKGFIPRMLHVRFILSFDFLRAVQSTYGSVYCCPGALSAYRTSVVRRVLDAWLNQKFLGEKCTYGEDRSMTNFIFSCGYNSVYQRNATVHTMVPETYSKLCKMFLRWDRSYIKEEIRLLGLIWKRPYPARIISIIDCFITNLRFPISYMALGFLIYFSIQEPMTMVRVLFMIGFISTVNIVYYLRSERSWDFIYGIIYSYFAFFTLFWIFPYALATVRSRSWMTR